MMLCPGSPEQCFLWHAQPKQKGKRQAAAAKPSEKDLQLSGLLYIMYLLANDEVRGTWRLMGVPSVCLMSGMLHL
jgi:hypothetical protein